MGFMPAARIKLVSDWRGTAEELAAEATAFLAESGFDEKFACTERLVRYYLTRGVLASPEKDSVDRRKALFGPLQFRQLVLTRLLAERGWDLERVIGQMQGAGGWKVERELDLLLNQLAEPTQAERLLFRSRREDAAGDNLSFMAEGIAFSAGKGLNLGSSPGERAVRESTEPLRSHKTSLARRILQSARSEEGGLDRLSVLAEKMLKEPNLTEAEVAALKEIAEMSRLAFRQPGKKERWTRVKLAPWCEVNIRIGKDGELSESQKYHIIKEFTRLMEDYDSRMGL
jgi:phenylpyruvate tautomerase PptA (4-oxalocrotonate tautomerase family)